MTTEIATAESMELYKRGRKDERKKILEIIDNQITKVEKMDCSEVLKQNMRWNLEEIKQLTNSEEIEK